MANRDIVAIGASAGGVEALMYLAQHLPADFPASVLVTTHLGRGHTSSFDAVLSRVGPLQAQFATDGAVLRKGRIYIAPPDFHLLIEKNRVRLGTEPRENHTRPAIDPMLRSAALCCCGRAVGVVLTGTLGDGASGLYAVRHCGGLTVVQDPKDAAYSEMPMTALNQSAPDHVARLSDLPALLTKLVHEPAGETSAVSPRLKYEVDIARGGTNGVSSMDKLDRFGRRSVLSCPDCGGVMWEIEDGDLVRYRCHVGHAYTAETMKFAMDENLWRALTTAQRTLEERVALAHKLRDQAKGAGQPTLFEMWSANARKYEHELNVIRDGMKQMCVTEDKKQSSESEAAPKGSP